MKLKMEQLKIEDLKILAKAIDERLLELQRVCDFNDVDSLEKSRGVIEQMIKERESKPLPF